MQCNLNDLHPIWPPNLTRNADNAISMIYTPFDHPVRPVKFDQASSQWISTQFGQFDHPIRPVIKLGRNSLRWCPIQPGINYWSNWVDLHPIRPASKAFNRQCNLNGFTPNSTDSTRQAYKCNLSEFLLSLTSISCPVEFQIRPVELGVSPLRLWPPNLTGH